MFVIIGKINTYLLTYLLIEQWALVGFIYQIKCLFILAVFRQSVYNEFAGFISRSLRPRNTASFEELSQRWRAVGNTVFDLTGQRFEPQTSRSRNKRVTARPNDRLFVYHYNNYSGMQVKSNVESISRFAIDDERPRKALSCLNCKTSYFFQLFVVCITIYFTLIDYMALQCGVILMTIIWKDRLFFKIKLSK